MFAYSERCPSNEELIPCVCKNIMFPGIIEVTCHGSNAENILTLEDIKKSFKSLHGKRNVEIYLNEMKLGKVPSNFFQGIGVEFLYIINCELDDLSDGDQPVLSGLESSLQVLHIHNIKNDNELTQMKLGHLKSLRKVSLENNRIKEINNNWFDKGLFSLEVIYLSDNGIEKLGDRAFEDLPNLHSLHIKGNHIGSIERGMLPSHPNRLRILSLQNNTLTSLPENIFSDMPNLNSVSLKLNGITRLDQDTWEPVWEQLSSIYLEGNPLICDSKMSWIFNLRVPYVLRGTCSSPEALRGRSLKDFINNKGK